MDINNGYDRHLDPPEDEIEQEDCEECYQSMEYHEDRLDKKTVDIWWKCTNPFCPSKFEKYKGGTISVVLDMSNHLAEVEQELADTKNSLGYANARIANLKIINERLTQSQSKGEYKMGYRSVSTILDTNYRVGDVLEKGIVSDITIEGNWGEHLAVTVWVRPTPDADETTAVIIPYHAVELLVK